MMNFLEKLDYLMEERAINKSKLSKISGVPYTTIDGFYKKGYENTKLSTIRRISEALNVSLDYLFDETSDKKNPGTTEAAPERKQFTLEESNRLLVAMGFIEEGQDLTDDDLAFLTHIIGLLNNRFSKRGPREEKNAQRAE